MRLAESGTGTSEGRGQSSYGTDTERLVAMKRPTQESTDWAPFEAPAAPGGWAS
jgi:hypothetical protein